MMEAVGLVARSEGILLDPVYTGKAMAGTLDLIRKGVFRKGQTLVFVHTGGSPALYVHMDAFRRRFPPPPADRFGREQEVGGPRGSDQDLLHDPGGELVGQGARPARDAGRPGPGSFMPSRCSRVAWKSWTLTRWSTALCPMSSVPP